jgi:hypothetical protein
MWHLFHPGKSPSTNRDPPAIHHNFTTKIPRLKPAFSRKPPQKHLFTMAKKSTFLFAETDASPCQKQREGASCSISEVLLWH